MTDAAHCLYEVDGNVGTITLNRPERRNAISFRMLGELTEHLQAAERDRNVRCVIITGAGKGFCSGLDLQDASAGTGIGSSGTTPRLAKPGSSFAEAACRRRSQPRARSRP